MVYEKHVSDQKSIIRSYDTKTGRTQDLASAQNPAGVTMSLVSYGRVYYSSSGGDAAANGQYLVDANGSNRKRLSEDSADVVVQQARNSAFYSHYAYINGVSAREWYRLDILNSKVDKLPQGPSIEISRGYVDSPAAKHSSFIEERDGKSELYLTGPDGSAEQKLTDQGGANQFVQWFGEDYMVFSSNQSGSSLYVISTAGGPAKKISDFYKGNGRTYAGGYNPSY